MKNMHSDWNNEAEQLELEKQENMNKMGMIPFWKAPQGETIIEVMSEHPPEDSNFAGKKDIHLLIDGEEKKWTVSKRSPIYREIVTAVANGQQKFKLIRVGLKADDTRYSLVAI